ncbi:MAG: DUF5103 domain-containing protein [Paramuribaculum sp.]|nr:DUF5103 domain-containing protein [Paramuribaculum sp.]
MVILRHILLSVLLWTMAAATASQPVRTAIFDPTIKTLQVEVAGVQSDPAVMIMDSDDRLTISFDQLADDRRYMRCSLTHCDPLWRPDNLTPVEYTSLNEDYIEDYALSGPTMVRYVNYRFSLPTQRLTLPISGNYLLRVYDESDPDSTLLQVAFCVLDPKLRVAPSVTSRTDIDYNDAHQQLSVALYPGDVRIADPPSELAVVVSQNGRPDTEVVLTTPMLITSDCITYSGNRGLIFPAGNEYRRMETVSVNYPSMHVEGVDFIDPFYHATLYTDEPRNTDHYLYDRTQHGRFRIREYNSDDSDTEADYLLTHFTLDLPYQPEADIYIDGYFTNHRFDPEWRMIYNPASGRYELTALLKQGAYNYQYLLVPKGSERGLTSPIEGDLYQTVNEYFIRVYYRPTGSRYYQLIGAGSVTSGL